MGGGRRWRKANRRRGEGGAGPGGGGLPRQNARLRQGFPRHYAAGRGAEEPLPGNLEAAPTRRFFLAQPPAQPSASGKQTSGYLC